MTGSPVEPRPGRKMHVHVHAQADPSAAALATTARTLQFLALIDSTIDIVSGDTEHIRVCATSIENCMLALQSNLEGTVSDEVRLIALLDKTLDMARRIHLDAKNRHASACDDGMLKDDDGVVDVYQDLIAASEELFNCAGEFKDWIETHNALLEPSTGKTFESVDDLMAALNAD
jgi:hypothetical protein